MRRRTATTIIVGFLATTFAASWMVTGQKTQAGGENSSQDGADIVYLGSEGVVFQDRSNNCGVAAIMMVLDHHGIRASQRKMEHVAKLDFKGVNFLTLQQLAEAAGLEAEGWRLGFDDLRRVQLPAILFTENHHFVVADSVDARDHLFIRDPAAGRLRIPRSRAIEIWKGETLVITRERR